MLLERDIIIEDIAALQKQQENYDKSIIELYEQIGTDSVDIDDKVYRRQRMTYNNFNIPELTKYLKDNFDSHIVKQIITKEIKERWIVNDNELDKLIKKKKISRDIRKFVTTTYSKYFLRKYDKDE